MPPAMADHPRFSGGDKPRPCRRNTSPITQEEFVIVPKRRKRSVWFECSALGPARRTLNVLLEMLRTGRWSD